MSERQVKKIGKIIKRQLKEREKGKPWFIPMGIWEWLIKKMYGSRTIFK